MKRLRKIENEDTPPTIGINIEELEPIDGITFQVFDFGGLPKMRPVWQSRLEVMDLEGSNCKNTEMSNNIYIEMYYKVLFLVTVVFFNLNI